MSSSKSLRTRVCALTAWFWISVGMVMYNKLIFLTLRWPFPTTLVMLHMIFSSAFATLLIKGFRVCEARRMPWPEYGTRVVPIAFFFALSLHFNQSAYVHLSVSFVQMIKTALPAVTFFVSVAWGALHFDAPLLGTILIITVGVFIASYGEIEFVWRGAIYQTLALVFEAIRLVLIEKLLKSKGLNFNPLQVLYYIAPCSVCFLALSFVVVELPALRALTAAETDITWWHLLANCANAFALNLAAFVLIGLTSALTMNVAGVVKDCVMIFLSYETFGSPVTRLNIFGFAISVAGVKLYNRRKQQIAAKAERQAKYSYLPEKDLMSTSDEGESEDHDWGSRSPGAVGTGGPSSPPQPPMHGGGCGGGGGHSTGAAPLSSSQSIAAAASSAVAAVAAAAGASGVGTAAAAASKKTDSEGEAFRSAA